ncbi:hypothetical protein JL722_11998 [Aureococcus anophagefferens]|nr:hypothetical protein JL722_11998 [Aureococcus anophagefferens]
MYSQLARGGAALEAAVLARPRPAVVHLVRNDSLARHVSVLANKHAKHGAERARADAHRAPPSPVAVRVPVSGVLAALEAQERDVRSGARCGGCGSRVSSSYEALAAAPGAAAAAAWRQLVGRAYAARPDAEPTPARLHAGAVCEHVANWPGVDGCDERALAELRLRRMERLAASPFERTLYLDSDALACARLDGFFAALGESDVAYVSTLALSKYVRRKTGLDAIFDASAAPPGAAPVAESAYLNAGVLAFRNSTGARRLLAAWRRVFVDEYLQRRVPGAHSMQDQPAL